MVSGVWFFCCQGVTQEVVQNGDGFTGPSVAEDDTIPMLRPSPVQLPLKGTGGIRNLYVLSHFLPDPKIGNLEVSPLFSITYALD